MENLGEILGHREKGCVQTCFEDHSPYIYVYFIGQKTKNGDEMDIMVRDLQLVYQYGYNSLILEGNSHILIQYLSNLVHGSKPDKILKNWCLNANLGKISKLFASITPYHVHEKENG
jgi:hypothetical protein